MPPEQPAPGSPEDWLRHAQSDLALAQAKPPPHVFYEQICFHAQQAAEKALKAVLIAHSIPLLKTHNIRALLDGLSRATRVPQWMRRAASLSQYAVETRYPGRANPVSEGDYRRAVRLAEEVVIWSEKAVARRQKKLKTPRG